MPSLDNWPKETIPDKDTLYQRVHKNHIINGSLAVGMVFRNIGNGMSTDWSKYSTPQKTKNRVKEDGKDPNKYGVIQMNVGKIRKIKDQVVDHTPTKFNRAHTDVTGEKDQETQILFNRIYNWAISLSP